MKDLLTVGTVAFDSIETPYGKAEMVIGGACTYASYAASYFTDRINLVSIVGDDFPKSEMEALEDKGVNLKGLEIKENAKSFFWAGKYHENMNKRDTLITDLNVLDDFDPVLPEEYKSSKYVMLGNITPELQTQVLDQLDGSQRLIAMDTMNFWMDIAWDELMKVIGRVDILTINDEEARQMSGEYSLVKAAYKIHELGPKFLVIKKGEHGALLFADDQIFYAPALPLSQVYDPTGAGDTFAGGFMGYLAKTDDVSFDNMKRAVIHGSAMASFCVEEFSIKRLKNLRDDEVKSRVKKFKQLTHFDL
jgi:sugar/nucleoside kinase (ribokinase family)